MPVITGDIELDPEAKIQWTPVDETKGPFIAEVSAHAGNPRIYVGYNISPIGWDLYNPDDRGFIHGIETDYDDGSGHHKMESYWQYQIVSGGGDPLTNTYRRPIMVQYDKVTNLPTVMYLGSGGNLGIQFCWNDGTGTPYQDQVVGKLKMQMGRDNLTVYNQPGGASHALNIDSSATGAVTGLDIVSQAVTFGTHLKVTSSGSNEGLYLDAKGTAPVVLNQDGGGSVLIPDIGFSFTNDQDTRFYRVSSNVAAFVAGGVSVLTIDGAASGPATGVKITSSPPSGHAKISVTSTSVNEGLDIDAKGAGTVQIGGASTGDIILSRDATMKKFSASYSSSNGLGAVVKNTTDITGTYGYEAGIVGQATGASTWYFAAYKSAAGTDNEFLFRGDGTAFCDGAWTGGGADYAEFFEWEDGNQKDQDRRGMTVVLTPSGKIRLSTAKDKRSSIFGTVSSRAAIIGDAAEMRWKDKYLRDQFGAEIEEKMIVLSWSENVNGTVVQKRFFADSIPQGEAAPPLALKTTEKRRKLNPSFDPSQRYIPRSQRREWAPIGIAGKLAVLKNQVKGDRWIKIHEVNKNVDLWLVR